MRKRPMIAPIVVGVASLAALATVGSGTALASNSVEERIAKLESKVSALEATLAGVTRSGNTLHFTGMNVQVFSGGGEAGNNGLGNLLVGENPGEVTGSNNVVLGASQTVKGWGNLVAGWGNTVANASGGYNFVAGGNNYDDAPAFSGILGGGANQLSGEWSTISGGIGNKAIGEVATVAGGWQNTASGFASAVFGGIGNTASGNCATAPLSANQTCEH